MYVPYASEVPVSKAIKPGELNPYAAINTYTRRGQYIRLGNYTQERKQTLARICGFVVEGV